MPPPQFHVCLPLDKFEYRFASDLLRTKKINLSKLANPKTHTFRCSSGPFFVDTSRCSKCRRSVDTSRCSSGPCFANTTQALVLLTNPGLCGIDLSMCSSCLYISCRPAQAPVVQIRPDAPQVLVLLQIQVQHRPLQCRRVQVQLRPLWWRYVQTSIGYCCPYVQV
jgi:hypothetical protein